LQRTLYFTACCSLLALIFLCLAWELWLAPLRPGGSWLALKTLPLLAPLMGVLHGRRYTYQWSAMLILAYFAEGIMRGFDAQGSTLGLALAETVLATVFFLSAVYYLRSADAGNP